jgi:hypothetical protein
MGLEGDLVELLAGDDHFSAIISAEMPWGTRPLAYRSSMRAPKGSPGPFCER